MICYCFPFLPVKPLLSSMAAQPQKTSSITCVPPLDGLDFVILCNRPAPPSALQSFGLPFSSSNHVNQISHSCSIGSYSSFLHPSMLNSASCRLRPLLLRPIELIFLTIHIEVLILRKTLSSFSLLFLKHLFLCLAPTLLSSWFLFARVFFLHMLVIDFLDGPLRLLNSVLVTSSLFSSTPRFSNTSSSIPRRNSSHCSFVTVCVKLLHLMHYFVSSNFLVEMNLSFSISE